MNEPREAKLPTFVGWRWSEPADAEAFQFTPLQQVAVNTFFTGTTTTCDVPPKPGATIGDLYRRNMTRRFKVKPLKRRGK